MIDRRHPLILARPTAQASSVGQIDMSLCMYIVHKLKLLQATNSKNLLPRRRRIGRIVMENRYDSNRTPRSECHQLDTLLDELIGTRNSAHGCFCLWCASRPRRCSDSRSCAQVRVTRCSCRVRCHRRLSQWPLLFYSHCPCQCLNKNRLRPSYRPAYSSLSLARRPFTLLQSTRTLVNK